MLSKSELGCSKIKKLLEKIKMKEKERLQNEKGQNPSLTINNLAFQ